MPLVCYLVNDDPFYLMMLANSITMLRGYNRKIAVRVVFVDQGTTSGHLRLFMQICRRLRVEFVKVKPFKPQKVRDVTFYLNKFHWTTQKEKQLLCLDADTFIFGDLEELFEAHRECDVYGSETSWIYSQPSWRRSYFSGVTPLNAGVLLWNRGSARQWNVQKYARLLSAGKLPESELLRATGKPVLMDEFSLWLSIAASKLSYRTFNLGYVNLGTGKKIDIPRSSLVFHSHSQRWLQTYRELARYSELPRIRTVSSYLEVLSRNGLRQTKSRQKPAPKNVVLSRA